MKLLFGRWGRGWCVWLYELTYYDISIIKNGEILGEINFGSRARTVWEWSFKTKYNQLPFRGAIDTAMLLNPTVDEMVGIVCNLVKEQDERERAATTS